MKVKVSIDEKKLNAILASPKFKEQGYDKAVKQGLNDIKLKTRTKIHELGSRYDIPPSLLSTINITRRAYVYTITFDSEYADYVEFGTGIVGASSPHPDATGYDLSNHGRKGWFFHNEMWNVADMTGYNKEKGSFYWTKGQPSRPIMYKTHDYIRNIAKRTLEDRIRRMIDAN